jgi:hypothetical protein
MKLEKLLREGIELNDYFLNKNIESYSEQNDYEIEENTTPSNTILSTEMVLSFISY